ncbi:interleukin-17 receptor C [Discoglossus pictus]
MKLYVVNAIIWALFLSSGIWSLETFTLDRNHVSCTGGIECEISDGWCLPGDKEIPYSPVLVPTHMKSRTVLRCNSSYGCLPCVEVEVDMSVDFLPEQIEDIKGENCDEYYSEDLGYNSPEDEEELGIPDQDFYAEDDIHMNESFLCANLFISSTNSKASHCDMVRVRIPLSSVPSSDGNRSVKVGRVMLTCFYANPDDNLTLMAYTQPRYHGVLNKTHHVPGCKVLKDIEEIKQCQVLDVRRERAVLHTACPYANLSKSPQRNEAFLLVSQHPLRVPTLCFMNGNNCSETYNVTEQGLRSAGSREQRVLRDFMAQTCMKVWSSGRNDDVYVCPQDKYQRRRWSLAWVLCILIIVCMLFFLILKKKELENWVKRVAGDASLDEIFKNRKVLILYSPDNDAYKERVALLASALKDLRLDVVLDQWYRIDMSRVNPMPWYHAQKSAVFNENGMVILLFSEGARQRLIEWNNRTTQQSVDPYGSFGATLNCIIPDFQRGKAVGRYVVGHFDGQLSRNDIPSIFQVVPILTLPSQMDKLLTVLAGSKSKNLSKKLLHQLSARASEKLDRSILSGQQNGFQIL